MKLRKEKKGISLIVLVITIIVIIILSSAVITSIVGENGIIEKAHKAVIENNRAEKEAELQNIAISSQLDTAIGEATTSPTVTTDIVQPWLCDSFSISDWVYHFELLKNVGITEVIIQWSAEFKNSKIKYLGYDSDLVNNPSNLDSEFDLNTYAHSKNMLKNMLEAAKLSNIKIFIGLCLGSDWWNNAFTDEAWRINNCNLTNQIANEIYTKYKSSYPNTFIGWYYPWEMYTTPKNYEIYWSDMLNRNLDYLTTLNSAMPTILCPFISQSENASVERAKEQWSYVAKNTRFRKGDILCLQDSLGTSSYSPGKIIEYIKAIELATNENTNLIFGLDVENYWSDSLGGGSASINRFTLQLQICSLYAKKIISFSYMHYYDSLNKGVDNKYNDQYTTYAKSQSINSSSSSVSIYIDSNKNHAPIPKGFTVSDKATENTIKDGLVIKDAYGNEFVWIPVDGGVKEPGQYVGNDSSVSYKKCYSDYLNTIDDSLPPDIASESSQIIKYGGFYIARYESAFDYNNGDIRVASIPSINCTTDIEWQNTRSQVYDNYLWNRVKYSEARSYSQQMDTKYYYDSSISTGLITGTQWDTVDRWLSLSNYSYYDSIAWGNYNNSMAPANAGNYQQSILKPSGSNENWKAKNIYDMAGNLSEWSCEANSSDISKKYFRSAAYNGNGTWGPACYRESTEWTEFYYQNIGFRVVLYLK